MKTMISGSSKAVSFEDVQIPNNDLTFLKRYFNFTPDDETVLSESADIAAKYAQRVIEEFYKHVTSNHATGSFFADRQSLERAKAAQTRYFFELTSGKYDVNYVESRLQVGVMHNAIKMPPKWYIGGYSYYLSHVFNELQAALPDNPQKVCQTYQAFVKLIMLDISLSMEAFVIERERELLIQQQKLEEQSKKVADAVTQLALATNQVAAVSTQLSSSTAQAVAAITQTTATAEEVRQTSEQASEGARKVSTESKAVVEVSKQGQIATESTIKGMARIREQMDSIAECMVQLSNQSKVIGDIIATVDDLAQQSNLLAVNASIEAAKAGEQGKGFAVVAQEVKNLSQQSKAATAHVRTILNDIVKATTAATMATEQGGRAVEAGSSQATEAGEVIRALTASIENSARAAEVIEVSGQQQLIGMQQMVEAMESIKIASEQNRQSAGQLESAAHNMEQLGKQLLDLTRKVD